MHETWLLIWREGLVLAGVPFLATALLIFLLKPVAVRLGLVDHPISARKTHADPTPLVGGAAITLAGLIAGSVLLPITPDLVALGAASVLLLVVGEFDDRYDINWRIRIVAQAAAGLLLYVGGVRVEWIGNALGFAGHTLGVLSLPFTVLATVGITNAINWADGVDGLAGSLSLAALCMLVAASIYAGNAELATALMLMGGCVMGFLAFNLRTPWRPNATVFLGCGAEILGLWIAWASFRLTQTPGHPVTPVLAPFLIAPPVIDCLVLIVRRLRARRSPFSADRDHMHHRLTDIGLTPTAIVALLVMTTLAVGFSAALARRVHVPEPVFPVVYLSVTCAYFFITRRARRRTSRPDAPRPLAEPAPVRATVERTEA
ncbi:MAG TPA: MraY family glycosyltransferase [Caulobacteraceae bacterium]|nr:MraY family glycosyltransferase [Caulobacteraceae bacterium]